MARPASTNDESPFFGPEHPVYPQVNQLVMVQGPPLIGVSPPTHSGVVLQFVPPLGTRPREQCFVFEVNGLTLGSGKYDCRLVGSYQGLPLYATACCVFGAFSSSSSSSGH